MGNKLILGDCLQVMKNMPDESIDLIYLDPPFFSNRNYEIIWGDAGEIRSFEDRWAGGINHYLDWLKERVKEMHRLLKPTGSIYLHCDWHANAYIRVYILDKIFGNKNFRNEISWKRTTTHNDHKRAKQYGHTTDTIFFYTKEKKYAWHTQFEHYTSDYVSKTYNKKDKNGRRFKASDLSAPNGGESTLFEWKGIKPPQNRYWQYSKEHLDEFDEQGLIYWSDNGKPYLKNYLDEMNGSSIDDFWNNCVFKNKAERIGYPTQKPEALLERIIKASSNEGDVIFDPFMGGGTTMVVAERLQRNFIGIDQSIDAVKVTEQRLINHLNIFVEASPFVTELYKYDYDTLRYKEPFEFESWIVQQHIVDGRPSRPNKKQRSDMGIDGLTADGVPIQVKRSDGIGRPVVQSFHGAIEAYYSNSVNSLFPKFKEEGKPIGYIIAFSFSREAHEAVAQMKMNQGIIIKLLEVKNIVPIASNPKVTLDYSVKSKDDKGQWEIVFTANTISESPIRYYSWNFDYQIPSKDTKIKGETFIAEQILERQSSTSHKFGAGTYNIAVKVVDTDGMESIEVIKLKVNGNVERE